MIFLPGLRVIKACRQWRSLCIYFGILSLYIIHALYTRLAIMKKIFLKNAVAASLLLATGYAEIASAHDLSGELGLAAGATDLYQITCSLYADTTPSARLETSITAGADPSNTRYPVIPLGVKVSVRAQRLFKATNVTDGKNNDGLGSPFASTNSGDGVYYVTVGKSARTLMPVHYSLAYHCKTAANDHADTSHAQLQNQ